MKMSYLPGGRFGLVLRGFVPCGGGGGGWSLMMAIRSAPRVYACGLN